MSRAGLRFLHASDFHLERPLAGAIDLPPALVEICLEAPYRAAHRVFDAALSQQVDFVLLAGDLLHPAAAGPRGLVFLVEQFERLQEKKVPVYWATGRADSGTRWAEVLHLPANVHLFSGKHVERVTFERDGRGRAEILGSGNSDEHIKPANYHASAGATAIGLGFGRLERQVVGAHGIHYWALGGRHRRSVVNAATPVVHYPGTPQGRTIREAGPHGCSLVQVDEHRHFRTRRIATDVVRWHDEKVRLDGSINRGDLERLLDSRAQALLAANPHHELLVRWTLQGAPAWTDALRRGRVLSDIADRLRHRFGMQRPGLWSLAVESAAPLAAPDEWYTEETIRGEYLRALRLADQDEARLDFHQFVSERERHQEHAPWLELEEPDARRRVFEEATLLGADLLSGEEPHA